MANAFTFFVATQPPGAFGRWVAVKTAGVPRHALITECFTEAAPAERMAARLNTTGVDLSQDSEPWFASDDEEADTWPWAVAFVLNEAP